MALPDDSAYPRSHPSAAGADPSRPRVYNGHLVLRDDEGRLCWTSVYMELAGDAVLLRYDDGVDHLGRRGDDLIDYFNALAPSLSRRA